MVASVRFKAIGRIGAICLSVLVTQSCGDVGGDAGVANSLAEKAVVEKVTFEPAVVPTVYRFAKISNGAYFYTGNLGEAQLIIANYPDFRYEGPAFEQDVSGNGQEVYRFANLSNGGYFYTGSAGERDIVIRDYPNMRYEGSTFSVAPAGESGAQPVYRLANLSNGAYLYTLNPLERDYAVSLGNWRAEGVSFLAPKGSVLANRTWSTGALVQADAPKVYSSRVDATGSANVVFLKNIGSRTAVNAVRGAPNASGGLDWLNSVVIDQPASGNPFTPSFDHQLTTAASDNGNFAAAWLTSRACGSDTYRTSGQCEYLVVAVYSAATKAWSAPQVVSGSPTDFIRLKINDQGDVTIAVEGWVRSGSSTYNKQGIAIYRRPGISVGLGFNLSSVSEVITKFDLSLDATGNILLTGSATRNSTSDIVAYRGNVGSGLGAMELLESVNAAATYLGAATSSNGRSFVFFRQSNGTVSESSVAASLTNPSASWTVFDFNSPAGNSSRMYFAPSDGSFAIWNLSTCRIVKNINGVWQSEITAAVCNLSSSFGGNNQTWDSEGNYLAVEGASFGRWRWVSYDFRRNRVIQSIVPTSAGPGSGWVLGFSPPSNALGWSELSVALGGNGTGLMLASGEFDKLSTLDAPLGDGRQRVENLWGFYLR